MFQGLSLVILGIISSASLLFAMKPNATALLNKIVPFQGWTGMGFCLWGIYSLISQSFSGVDQWPHQKAYWIAVFLVSIMQILTGYLLGFSMISKYVFSGNEEARKRGDQHLLKRAPLLGMVGLAGIVTGLGSMLIFVFF